MQSDYYTSEPEKIQTKPVIDSKTENNKSLTNSTTPRIFYSCQSSYQMFFILEEEGWYIKGRESRKDINVINRKVRTFVGRYVWYKRETL